jgi:ribonuclease HI
MSRRKEFYAVRHGRDPVSGEPVRNRILTSWEETSALVHGAPGARYAGFATEAEAREWLGAPADSTASQSKDDKLAQGRRSTKAADNRKKVKPAETVNHPADVLCCYVDGSFNEMLPNYGYGLVCVCNGEIVHSAGGAGRNGEAISMRQIAGELLGAMQGLLFALRAGYEKVVILHDYLGVANHATGAWKRTNPFSVTYYKWMQDFFAAHPSLCVSFEKVPAHSGLLYNELADVLAKRSVGMAPEPRWLAKAEALGLVGGDEGVKPGSPC